MYVCGITPYDATHLGHAFTYLTFDLVQRVWRDAGFDVHYTQNVTDVDDPLLERANDRGIDWRDLAGSEIELFRGDMAALRIIPPREFVGVVEAVPLVAAMVERLRARGATYDIDGDIYFPIDADANFGGVSGLDRETMLALSAERGGDPERDGKKDPLDPLLWRAARPGEPSWESSLGAGRPGWHVECSAISLDNLGMSFDLEGGGSDLVFPHHEMSASHAQVATAEFPHARAYTHAAMVGLDGEKMSKSLGNLVLVSKLRGEEGMDPMAIRLALLGHHYRTDWEWTAADRPSAEARIEIWRHAVARPSGPDAAPVLAAVRARMADDLDTPGALRAIDTWAAAEGDDTDAPALVRATADALLGIAL
jgi:L-cysteine:1D-myo-inositol 2-amino-2-deoxy-alpha-D-glucopyranoside ligase